MFLTKPYKHKGITTATAALAVMRPLGGLEGHMHCFLPFAADRAGLVSAKWPPLH